MTNDPEGYLLADELYISNYLVLNIKNKSDRTFELYQSHFIDKIINQIGLTLSAGLNHQENLFVKLLPHKGMAVLERKLICNYRAEV